MYDHTTWPFPILQRDFNVESVSLFLDREVFICLVLGGLGCVKDSFIPEVFSDLNNSGSYFKKEDTEREFSQLT